MRGSISFEFCGADPVLIVSEIHQSPDRSLPKVMLMALLSSTEADVIQQALQLGLARSLTCDRISAVRLLEDLIIESRESRHCIRCHSDYFQNENGPSACQMEHLQIDNSTWERVLPGSLMYRGRLQCCGQWEYPDGHPLPAGPDEPTDLCIETWHTPNHSEIQGSDNYNFQRAKEDCKICDHNERCVAIGLSSSSSCL